MKLCALDFYGQKITLLYFVKNDIDTKQLKMSAAMRRLSEAIVNAFRNSGPDAESGIPLPTNLGPTQHKLTGSSSSASSSFVEGDTTVVVDDTIYEYY